mmetsp:Transcript_30674/g.37463  ORF Transcript_30674/g.37463 Transcript_30674/m.37463 type:complete len:206 (+) Transcript_30674:254-871(+)
MSNPSKVTTTTTMLPRTTTRTHPWTTTSIKTTTIATYPLPTQQQRRTKKIPPKSKYLVIPTPSTASRTNPPSNSSSRAVAMIALFYPPSPLFPASRPVHRRPRDGWSGSGRTPSPVSNSTPTAASRCLKKCWPWGVTTAVSSYSTRRARKYWRSWKDRATWNGSIGIPKAVRCSSRGARTVPYGCTISPPPPPRRRSRTKSYKSL